MNETHDATEPLVGPATRGESCRPDSSPSQQDSAQGARPNSGTLVKALRGGLARHTLGIVFLLATVVLWTASNFLASTILADNTYSKPYLVTYINCSGFSVLLFPILIGRAWDKYKPSSYTSLGRRSLFHKYSPIDSAVDQGIPKSTPEDDNGTHRRTPSVEMDYNENGTQEDVLSKSSKRDVFDVRGTAKLSAQFYLIWFMANYFIAVCLEYTTVASSTILTSTSSIWTLLFGSLVAIEKFSLRKLVGVLASLAGIALISTVDLSSDNDKNRGSFPHKSHAQIAIGDGFALCSAILYGVYTTLMKKKIGDESRINMFLFFGFVGVLNMITLLPGFALIHLASIERFQMPPSKHVWVILLVNAITSVVSDICWAYSMLLTSPLVVTVGISLTIPLSIVGQMVINSQSSSALYWVGASIVFLSFAFITYESKVEEGDEPPQSSRP